MRGRGYEIWQAGRQASKHNFIRGILKSIFKNAGRRMSCPRQIKPFLERKVSPVVPTVDSKIPLFKRKDGKLQGGEGVFCEAKT